MGSTLNKLVFQPPPSTYTDNPHLIWLRTQRNNSIPSFFIYKKINRLTLLFSHGNAEDLGSLVNCFKELAAVWDVNIFAYEYSGYGCSTGKPSEQDVYADIEAAYEYLTETMKILPSTIVLYGRSLGSGASVHMGLKKEVAGIILQSPLLSTHRIVLNLRISLPGDMFCNIDKISRIKCPIFIIHGIKDEIVPFSHGVKLYNSCLNAVTPYWVESAGHNDIETIGRDDFIINVKRFLKFVLTPDKEQYRTALKKNVWKMPLVRGVLT